MRFFLKIVLYLLFAVFCFAGFTFFLFPFDEMKTRVAHEIEKRLGPDYQVSIDEMTPSLPSGIHLRSVELKSRSGAIPPIKISEANLKFYPRAFLSGVTKIDFTALLGTSEVSGNFFARQTTMAVNLKFDRFDLRHVTFLTKSWGKVTGYLSGSTQMEIYPDDFLRDEGNVTFQFSSLKFDQVELATSLGPYKLPPIGFGNGTKIDIGVSRGNIDVRSIQLTPGDLGIELDGKIYGAKRLDNFRLNLKGKLKVVSPALQQDAVIKIALGKMQKEAQPDGSFSMTATGRFVAPDGRFVLPNIRVGETRLEDLFKSPAPAATSPVPPAATGGGV